MNSNMQSFMKEALVEARQAAREGEVPVGALVVYQGRILGRGHNRMEQRKDATCHGEILAIQDASKALGRWRLDGCHLYVTLEPCLMCLGAIRNCRVERLIVGAPNTKNGTLEFLRTAGQGPGLGDLEVYEGILEEECSLLLNDFFKEKRI